MEVKVAATMGSSPVLTRKTHTESPLVQRFVDEPEPERNPLVIPKPEAALQSTASEAPVVMSAAGGDFYGET